MIQTWDDLTFFNSVEWATLRERLDDLETRGIPFNPSGENLFAALDASPLEITKVCILGQDPYPQPSMATGVAFSIPDTSTSFPPTLLNIFKEYTKDLGLPFPSNGDLSSWCRQGVLLWNVVPTCYAGSPGSHRNWKEWELLTDEIIHVCHVRKVVFVSLGGLARKALDRYFWGDEPTYHPPIFSFSHPSPLGANAGRNPFIGSRVFSRVNASLTSLGIPKIDWRLV